MWSIAMTGNSLRMRMIMQLPSLELEHVTETQSQIIFYVDYLTISIWMNIWCKYDDIIRHKSHDNNQFFESKDL